MFDFRVDKVVRIGGLQFIPSMDVFNVTNTNTVQSQRRIMYSYNHATGVGSSPNRASTSRISRVARASHSEASVREMMMSE